MKGNIWRLIILTVLFSAMIWVFNRYVMMIYKENFKNGKIEIQTVHGSSDEVNDIMANMNIIGNQLLEDARYDKVDDRILNSRKKNITK
jgi:hypothetical protein